jgi:hypothetical protein
MRGNLLRPKIDPVNVKIYRTGRDTCGKVDWKIPRILPERYF